MVLAARGGGRGGSSHKRLCPFGYRRALLLNLPLRESGGAVSGIVDGIQ